MIEAIIAFVTLQYIPLIIGYTAGGALYALLKWVIQLLKLRSMVLEINSRENYKDSDKAHARDAATNKVFGNYNYPPKASQNKGNLFMWALFWPFNLVYTMFADVARTVWDFLYAKLGHVLDAIGRAILPK